MRERERDIYQKIVQEYCPDKRQPTRPPAACKPYPYMTSTIVGITDGGKNRLINVLTWPKIWFNYSSSIYLRICALSSPET